MCDKKHIRRHILFFLLFFSGISWGQNHFSIPLKVGYSANTPINLNEDKINHSNGVMFQLGMEYQFNIHKNIFIETGLAGRTTFAFGKTKKSTFKARTLRLRLPIKVGWTISEKWSAASGIGIQNNQDFKTIHLRDKYFWRGNFVLEGKYNWEKNWFITSTINYELRNLPNAYFINDPRLVISFGVGRKI